MDGMFCRYMAVVDWVTNRSPRGLPQRNRISAVQCVSSHFIDKTESKDRRKLRKKEKGMIANIVFFAWFCVCLCYFFSLSLILKSKLRLQDHLKDAIIDGYFAVRRNTQLFYFQIGV
jgi:hypothetical protein